jgi:hypothetical protein
MAFKIAGAIASDFPRADPQCVADLFQASLALQGEPTLEAFRSQIGRQQLAVARQRAGMAQVKWLRPTTDPAAPGADGPQDPTAQEVQVLLDTLPPIVQRQGFYWLRDLASPHFGELYGSRDAHIAIVRKYAGTLQVHTPKGTARELGDILQDYSIPLLRVRTDYLATHNSLDPASAELTLSRFNPRNLQAKDHPHVTAWLQALTGENYPVVLQWIASLFALNRPAPALYLCGREGVGKSLLATGLGLLWGCAPARLSNVVGDFNAALLRTPLVLAEEGFPEDMDFAQFRDLLTESTRCVNEKFQPLVDVDGHIRMLICANNLEMFAFQRAGVVTSLDAEAIAKRLIVIDAKADALPHVEGIDTTDWPQQIAEHALHVRATVPLTDVGSRWAVAATANDSRRLSYRLGAARYMGLVDLLTSYLQTPERFEKTWGKGTAADWCMRVKDGELLVSQDVIKLLDKINLVDFRRALELIRLHEIKRRPRVPKNEFLRPVYAAINVDTLALIIDLDVPAVQATLSRDTETRLNLDAFAN